MKTKILPFVLITVALFLGLIVQFLLQDGMFMDATLYTCVSKNLANGTGTFWFPISDATWIIHGKTSFHEHPPLVFGIQSLFFKLLGNSLYTERVYTFLMAVLTAWLIFLIWKEFVGGATDKLQYAWLPILFWILTPLTQWTFQNNMMENTMGIFALTAILVSFKGLRSKKFAWVYMVFSGLLVFMASFSKGVPGLFPIGAIGLFWLVYRKPSFGAATVYTLIALVVPVLIYYLLMLNPDANEALRFYIKYRLLDRIDTAQTVSNRFHTLIGLISHLLPVIAISAILLIVFRLKKFQAWFAFKKEALFILLVGLSATMPLMLTKVQKDFYFSHAIPFFALAFALVLVPGIDLLIKRINTESAGFKGFKVFSGLLLATAIGLTIWNIGGQSRDADQLHDVHLFGKTIPNPSIIAVEPDLIEDWGVRLYLVRHYNISSDIDNGRQNYLLKMKRSDTTGTNLYQKLDLDTRLFDLYVKKTQTQNAKN
jgi:4-amino-4-deoxy-L-arabinose transferase-like glycosyltransferase